MFRVRLETTIRLNIALNILIVVFLLVAGVWGLRRPPAPPHQAAAVELHDDAEVLDHEKLQGELAAESFYHPGLRIVVWTHWDDRTTSDEQVLHETWDWARVHPEYHLTGSAASPDEPRWADDILLVSLSVQKKANDAPDTKDVGYAAGIAYGANVDHRQAAFDDSSILHHQERQTRRSGYQDDSPYSAGLDRLDDRDWTTGVSDIVDADTWLIERPRLRTLQDGAGYLFGWGIGWAVLAAIPLFFLYASAVVVRDNRRRLAEIESRGKTTVTDTQRFEQRRELLSAAHARLEKLDRRTVFTTIPLFGSLEDDVKTFGDVLDEIDELDGRKKGADREVP